VSGREQKLQVEGRGGSVGGWGGEQTHFESKTSEGLTCEGGMGEGVGWAAE